MVLLEVWLLKRAFPRLYLGILWARAKTCASYASRASGIARDISGNRTQSVMLLAGRDPICMTRDLLKVLASETRVAILMHLRNGQKTVTSLSKEMGKSKATLHEHLIRLQEAGLVERQESRRKWVYYQLTSRGRRLVDGKPTMVMFHLVVFAASTLLAIGVLQRLVTPYRWVPGASGARSPVLWVWFFALLALSVFFLSLLIHDARTRGLASRHS